MNSSTKNTSGLFISATFTITQTIMSEVFWTFFVSSMVGFCIVIAKMCYKSKCKNIDMCCVKIVRDVDVEERELEFVTQHPSIDSSVKGIDSITLDKQAQI